MVALKKETWLARLAVEEHFTATGAKNTVDSQRFGLSLRKLCRFCACGSEDLLLLLSLTSFALPV
jgi:hypothetical protein